MNQPSNHRHATGLEIRQLCRTGQWRSPTAGMAEGYAQANLVILPRDRADDFLLFCQRNPRPCPLLDMTKAGDVTPPKIADDCDIRTDLPRYRLWRNGQLVDEPTDLTSIWQDDFVSFLIGCSFTFEAALSRAGIAIRHVDMGLNVPMYRTSIPCESAGPFRSEMVVSMRPIPHAQVDLTSEITAAYPDVHGQPIQIGDPAAIGIDNIDAPDFGDAVVINEGEVPVFWACGVTPQLAIANASPPIAITHSPGCMLVTDLRDETLKQ